MFSCSRYGLWLTLSLPGAGCDALGCFHTLQHPGQTKAALRFVVVVSACYVSMRFHAKISFPCGEGVGSMAVHQSKGTLVPEMGDAVSDLIPNKALQEASQICHHVRITLTQNLHWLLS